MGQDRVSRFGAQCVAAERTFVCLSKDGTEQPIDQTED